jgi:hypothetical protein
MAQHVDWSIYAYVVLVVIVCVVTELYRPRGPRK